MDGLDRRDGKKYESLSDRINDVMKKWADGSLHVRDIKNVYKCGDNK